MSMVQESLQIQVSHQEKHAHLNGLCQRHLLPGQMMVHVLHGHIIRQ